MLPSPPIPKLASLQNARLLGFNMNFRENGSSSLAVNPWNRTYYFFSTVTSGSRIALTVSENRPLLTKRADLPRVPKIVNTPPAVPNIAVLLHVLHQFIDVKLKHILDILDSAEEGQIIFRFQLCSIPTESCCCLIGSNEGSYKFIHNEMKNMMKYHSFRKRKKNGCIRPEIEITWTFMQSSNQELSHYSTLARMYAIVQNVE